jgi:D-alanine-D-alanine ligase
MKVAIVYNRESRNVINLFGMPNKEIIGKQTIARVANALKKAGHQVTTIEGDKDLVTRLEEFMPRVVKGERPGMVFNVSYGIQGQARYTHVPGILEMMGVPYVASGPLAHSLSLDKVVTKMILKQHGIPTAEFAVMTSPESPVPDLSFPLIVKPKNESVSFGLRVVNDPAELREGSSAIFNEFSQPVLVERYIEGREINVGLLGNQPPEAFPPVELIFDSRGPRIYSFEDKKGTSGRTISHQCPAPMSQELSKRAQELAIQAFDALGCYDCARVDMRLDDTDNLYILETNSLPSLGEHGSYLVGAEAVGLDFDAFVNRLVEVASARYFGTPEPPSLEGAIRDPDDKIFSFVTQRRDSIERSLREWVHLSSRSGDPIGMDEALKKARRLFSELRMTVIEDLSDERAVRTWATQAGLDGGTLFVGHLDVPGEDAVPSQMYRREPEWLYGDGVGSSRGPLVMLEFALRAVRSIRRLRTQKLGVLLHCDEGRDARYSAEIVKAAAARAARVVVLRPGGANNSIITQRRGQRRYRLRVVGDPRRPGRASKQPEPLRWTWNQLELLSSLSSRAERVSVSALELKSESLPMLLPHRIMATILATFPDTKTGGKLEERMRASINRRGAKWELERISDRPSMVARKSSGQLVRLLEESASKWEMPLKVDSSVWPSVAGLVPDGTPCICGVGPVARELGTPQEAVNRTSLVQRTLLLARFILQLSRPDGRSGGSR